MSRYHRLIPRVQRLMSERAGRKPNWHVRSAEGGAPLDAVDDEQTQAEIEAVRERIREHARRQREQD